MRMMLRFKIPVDRGNAAIKDGSMSTTFQALVDELAPEAVYFYAEKGERAGMMVFDMDKSSKIPRIAERLFLDLSASIDLQPVMNQDELKTGFEAVSL